MRSTIEDQLNLIAKGEANYDRVLRQTIEAFRQKYLYFVKSIEAMDSLFEVSFTTLAATGKALSRYLYLYSTFTSYLNKYLYYIKITFL